MGSRLKTVAVILAVVGVLLCALAVTGQLLYSYYRLRPWVHHPLLFGVSGCIVLAAAWGLGVRNLVIKWVGLALIVVVGVGWVGIAWVGSIFREDLVELSRSPGPDGNMELVVYEGRNMIDPTWELRVYTRRGLLSRENDLGCVNSDIRGLEDIEWVGPRTVRAQLSRGETVDITLNANGRPNRRLAEGC